MSVLNWGTMAGHGRGRVLLERNLLKGLPLPKEKSPHGVTLTDEAYDARWTHRIAGVNSGSRRRVCSRETPPKVVTSSGAVPSLGRDGRIDLRSPSAILGRLAEIIEIFESSVDARLEPATP